MGADFSRICAWFVVNREAYGEGLRPFLWRLVITNTDMEQTSFPNQLKKIIALFIMLCFCNGIKADFEVNGLSYTVLSLEDRTVALTRITNTYVYQYASWNLPAYITYNGQTFTVKQINSTAANYSWGSGKGISSITIPATVETIQAGAFSMIQMTKLIISDADTKLGVDNMMMWAEKSAFNDCRVQELYIGRNIGYLLSLFNLYHPFPASYGEWAELNKLTIGPKAYGVKNYLGSNPNIKEINCMITVPEEAEYVFHSDVYVKATLYVPRGMADRYRAAQGWRSFLVIEEKDFPSGIQSLTCENDGRKYFFGINGQEMDDPRKGINIIRESNGRTRKVIHK